MRTGQSKTAQIPVEFIAGAADARRFTRIGHAALVMLYALFLLVWLDALPYGVFLCAAPILVARWMLAVHELFHLRTARQVDPVMWLLPLLLSPLTLGYREMQDVHLRHHRLTATPDDAEYYQLRGAPWLGLLNATLVPEQAFCRWVAGRGIDYPLSAGVLTRLALFSGWAWLLGAAFWAYWLPVRLAFGISNFAFFYALHRRGQAFGTFPLRLPPWACQLFVLLLGREAMLATCHHDVHHAYPRIAARHLLDARRYIG